jgi:2-dehydropantoate 2-reductase
MGPGGVGGYVGTRLAAGGQNITFLARGLDEAHAVARAKGIGLPDDFVERTLARCDRVPYAMKSSMLQDLERGRRLELPWLSGTIVRRGQELGIPTPTHAFIASALKLHAAGRGLTGW